MLMQIREGDERSVQAQVIGALSKCSEAMQISLSDNAMKIITEDLIDMYKYESIQDIIDCLKAGRRGVYGINSYGKLNLELITKWMAVYLDAKYLEREKVEKQKQTKVQEDHDFNREEFYAKGKEYIAEQDNIHKNKNKFSSATYDQLKHQYFNEKKDGI